MAKFLNTSATNYFLEELIKNSEARCGHKRAGFVRYAKPIVPIAVHHFTGVEVGDA